MGEKMTLEKAAEFMRLVDNGQISGRISEWVGLREACGVIHRHLTPPAQAVDVGADEGWPVRAEELLKTFSAEIYDLFADTDEISQSSVVNALELAIKKHCKFPVADFDDYNMEGVLLTIEQRQEAVQAAIGSTRAVNVGRLLAALGHVCVPNTRCLARVAETPPAERPPGPQNPPMWCCLPEGHDGPHRHNGGGMYPSIPFRDTDEVVMGDPLPGHCKRCDRIWPCDDAKALTAALPNANGKEGCPHEWEQVTTSGGVMDRCSACGKHRWHDARGAQ